MADVTARNLSELLLADPEALEQYRARKLTAADLARRYGFRESYVLTTLSRLGVKRPKNPSSTYQQQRNQALLAETRREFREFLAVKVRAGQHSLKRAAEIAGCSERTMRRYVEKAEK